MFCGNCGKKLEDGSRFCDGCGSQIGQPVSRGSQFGDVKQKIMGMAKLSGNKPVMIGVVALILIVILSAVIIPGKGRRYRKCIEAYQEYYKEESRGSGLDVMAMVSVDKDGLPLLWLRYGYSRAIDDVVSVQLLKFEKGKVKVLAEAKETNLYPIMSDEGVYALGLGWDNIYVCDKYNRIFKSISFSLPGMEDFARSHQIVLKNNNINFYNYYFAKNSSKQMISYIGRGRGFDSNWKYDSDDQFFRFQHVDGHWDSWEEALKKVYSFDDTNSEGYSVLEVFGAVDWLIEMDANAMFRLLQDKPAYSSKDLVTLLVANGLYSGSTYGESYSIQKEIDLSKYSISE